MWSAADRLDEFIYSNAEELGDYSKKYFINTALRNGSEFNTENDSDEDNKLTFAFSSTHFN